MNLKGLTYNTRRERLILPEYGRQVQSLVDYCMTIADRGQRQRCAEAIVKIMDRMYPADRDNKDHVHKLWDNLARMSGFKLDVDYPFNIDDARRITQKPQPMAYPMTRIPVRHYGNMMFKMFDKLKSMEPGRERDELTALVANQMKRDLIMWGHGPSDNEKVASDLARFTDGRIQLDLGTFKFERMNEKSLQPAAQQGNGKKKKK